MSQSQPLPTVESVEISPSGDSDVKARYLTDDEIETMLGMSALGHPISHIAEKLDRRWNTIAEALKRHRRDSTVEIATSAVESDAYEAHQLRLKAAQIAAEKGDHRPAQAILVDAGVAKDGAAAGATVGIQVVIGMPGAPAGPDPYDRLEGAKVLTNVDSHVP